MIKPSTLSFLEDLRENNNREWFQANRSRFEAARLDMESLASRMIEQISAFDADVASLEPAKTVFRQYRDVRFSADKTPYKVHMGAFFNKGGKHINNAGYYIHLEPGKSLYAGGLWMPESKDLASVRQEIDYNLEEWLSILNDPRFKKHFPGGIDTSSSLKRPPKGYDPDNQAIDFLKLKSFTSVTGVNDKTLTSKEFDKKIADAFRAVSPLIKFLNRAIE